MGRFEARYDGSAVRVGSGQGPGFLPLGRGEAEKEPAPLAQHLLEKRPSVCFVVLSCPSDAEPASLANQLALKLEPWLLAGKGDDETGWQELTPREREVLTLIGGGAANGEIAEALYISKRTVETHIRHIYAKLGVKRRTQAVLYAVRNGVA